MNTIYIDFKDIKYGLEFVDQIWEKDQWRCPICNSHEVYLWLFNYPKNGEDKKPKALQTFCKKCCDNNKLIKGDLKSCRRGLALLKVKGVLRF